MLDVVHEIGILAVMLLFIWIGGTMMQSYAGFGDFLPVLAGFALMITGAIVVVRTPHRLRKRSAERYARLEHEANEAADADEEYVEGTVATRPRLKIRA
ncbi:MAG TPA: hypothetical protein VM681_07955 [Candidatus Thermoplasmatota archaeon]|nr:hypothetical protein [Candidatus Thermoplasmatota archaeon]